LHLLTYPRKEQQLHHRQVCLMGRKNQWSLAVVGGLCLEGIKSSTCDGMLRGIL